MVAGRRARERCFRVRGLDPETPDALREVILAFFKQQPAEFVIRVQLNTGLDDLPIEDAQAKWSEGTSRSQKVGKVVLRIQYAWDTEKDGYFEDISFSPNHGLVAHRPLGSINRAPGGVHGALVAETAGERQRAARAKRAGAGAELARPRQAGSFPGLLLSIAGSEEKAMKVEGDRLSCNCRLPVEDN